MKCLGTLWIRIGVASRTTQGRIHVLRSLVACWILTFLSFSPQSFAQSVFTPVPSGLIDGWPADGFSPDVAGPNIDIFQAGITYAFGKMAVKFFSAPSFAHKSCGHFVDSAISQRPYLAVILDALGQITAKGFSNYGGKENL